MEPSRVALILLTNEPEEAFRFDMGFMELHAQTLVFSCNLWRWI